MPDEPMDLIHRLAVALRTELLSCEGANKNNLVCLMCAQHEYVRKLLDEAKRYEREHS